MANSSVLASVPGLLGQEPINWYQSCSVSVLEVNQWQSQSIHGGSPELHQLQSQSIHGGSPELHQLQSRHDPVREAWQNQPVFPRGAHGGNNQIYGGSRAPQELQPWQRHRSQSGVPQETPLQPSGSWQASPHLQTSCSTNGKIPQHKDLIDRMIDKFDHMNSQLDLVLKELGRQREEIESRLYMTVSLPNSCMIPNPNSLNSHYEVDQNPNPMSISNVLDNSFPLSNPHPQHQNPYQIPYVSPLDTSPRTHQELPYQNPYQFHCVSPPAQFGMSTHSLQGPAQIDLSTHPPSGSAAVATPQIGYTDYRVKNEQSLKASGKIEVVQISKEPKHSANLSHCHPANVGSFAYTNPLKEFQQQVSQEVSQRGVVASQHEETAHKCVNISVPENETNVRIYGISGDVEEGKVEIPMEHGFDFTSRPNAKEQSNKKNYLDTEFQISDDEAQLAHVSHT